MDPKRYAHYWHREAEYPELSYLELALDVTSLFFMVHTFRIDGQPERIRGWDGNGEPTFSKDDIEFNGDMLQGLHHETLSFPRVIGITDMLRGGPANFTGHLQWDFVKTAKKPYDTMVTATLLLACFRLGSDSFDPLDKNCTMAIRSTGGIEVWEKAFCLARDVLLVSPDKRWTGGEDAAVSRLTTIMAHNIISPKSSVPYEP